jgi:hypothetical protein
VSSPTIFVINDNTRAYPAYVITYEAPNDRLYYAASSTKATAAAATKAAATVAASKAAFVAATAAATKALAPSALQKSARTPRASGPSPPLGIQKVGAISGKGKGDATRTPTASSTDALKDKNNAELKKRDLQESTGRKQKRQRSDINGRADEASVSLTGGGRHAVGGADSNGGIGIFRTRATAAFSHDVIVIDD